MWGRCPRRGRMRRSVVRSELPPRFAAPKAPLGDQGELSAKLTERIRTLLFRPYQRRNVADRRIRILRIRIGTLPSATPLLHNSSVAFGDSSFYTKEPLGCANPLPPLSGGGGRAKRRPERVCTLSVSLRLTALPKGEPRRCANYKNTPAATFFVAAGLLFIPYSPARSVPGFGR